MFSSLLSRHFSPRTGKRSRNLVHPDPETGHMLRWNNRAAFLQTSWMMATAPRTTIADRMAYLNLACRFQRLCAVSQQQQHPLQINSLTSQPTALISMVTWAIAYRYRDKASSPAYWIIFLVVWISNTLFSLMNVSNNISWESDLLAQIAPEYPQGSFWLAVLGIRSMCLAKHKHHDNADMELK